MIATTLRSQERNTSQGPGNYVAASLTKGSATGEGVNQPGRRQEDDVNIVAFDTYNQTVSEQAQTLRDPNGTFGDALPAVAFALAANNHGNIGQGHNTNYVSGPLGGGNDGIGRRSEDDPNTVVQTGVRRLTPTECERLQSLPDGWTQLGDTPDSRRYSALGDAVTANVAQWIGERLTQVASRAPGLEAAQATGRAD